METYLQSFCTYTKTTIENAGKIFGSGLEIYLPQYYNIEMCNNNKLTNTTYTKRLKHGILLLGLAY